MCYLGGKTYFSPVSQMNTGSSCHAKNETSSIIFKQAFFMTSSNPKALIFVSALLPQFIQADTALVPQVTALCFISAMIHFAIYLSYAALGERAKSLLNNNQRRQRFNQFSGVIFLVFGIFIGLSTI
ncbi:LysE family transporter [Shewanella sp. VB17]|nr:LysE family transporter [Shewanella sp. VB17]